jgi:hypothetical protein
MYLLQKKKILIILSFSKNQLFISFFFCGIRVWIQVLMIARQAFLPLEPFRQPFCSDRFSQDRLSRLASDRVLLISASRVARITTMSHQCPVVIYFFVDHAFGVVSKKSLLHPKCPVESRFLLYTLLGVYNFIFYF